MLIMLQTTFSVVNLAVVEHLATYDHLEDEYKQMQYFVKSGGFIEPVEETFPGDSYVQKRDSATGTVKQVAVLDYFQRVPLKLLLEKVLEMPVVLQKILDWQQRKDGGVLKDRVKSK